METDSFSFEYTGSGYILNEVKDKSVTKITVPDEISGVKITEIAEWTFEGCTELKEVKLPESVEIIGAAAFYRCGSLESINIPKSIKNIGEWAFYACNSLTEITLPQGLEEIKEGAFYDCKGLLKVKLPSSVKSIGENAFPEQCKVTK